MRRLFVLGLSRLRRESGLLTVLSIEVPLRSGESGLYTSPNSLH